MCRASRPLPDGRGSFVSPPMRSPNDAFRRRKRSRGAIGWARKTQGAAWPGVMQNRGSGKLFRTFPYLSVALRTVPSRSVRYSTVQSCSVRFCQPSALAPASHFQTDAFGLPFPCERAEFLEHLAHLVGQVEHVFVESRVVEKHPGRALSTLHFHGYLVDGRH